MRYALNIVSAGIMLLALAGCSGTSGTTPAPGSGNGSIGSATQVTVAVTPSSSATVDAGQTVALVATLTGDTGNKGVTWTVSPGGGTLASTTGLTNTYTAPSAAVTSVTITATSVLDSSKYASATVIVNSLPSFTSTGQLAAGFAGVAYSTTLTSTGGTGARTYALSSGTLPAGLSLNTATGVISGTPSAGGSSTFSIAVADSAAVPVRATASFTLGISALQINAPALPAAVAGRAYPTSTYTSAYAQGAVTYAVTSGNLPAGITLSAAGVLGGTATSAGDSTFTVTATDASGQKASAAGTIHVVSALQFNGATLPSTQAGTAFAGYTAAASGGTGPYTYSLAAGSALPAGMTLSATGALAGTPTTPGNYTFSIVAADSAGAASSSSQTATATFTLHVTVATLAFSTTSLGNVVAGSPYSQTVLATGGVAPYSFTVVSGTLPTGLQLSAAGQFTGRASTTGPYTFTIQVTDSEGTPQIATQVFTLQVAATLTPGANNAVLKGGYAFVFHGVNNGSLATGASTSGQVFGTDMAGTFVFDGTSLLTGVIDRNDAVSGAVPATAITGSYAVGADQRGQVVFTYGSTTVTLDLAVSGITNGVAGKFRFIEADADNAINVNQVQGSGEALLQNPAAFNAASLTGGYVFRMSGETPGASVLAAGSGTTTTTQFGALAAAGYLQFNGAGLIARGTMDASSYNTAFPLISLTGSYSAPDANGRGTMTINTIGTGYPLQPTHYVYYVISAKQIAILSSDSHLSTSLMAGMAYQQQQALYTAASLTGTVIGAESAVEGGNGSTTFPSTLAATFYVLKVTGVGTMSGYSADNTAGASETFVNSPDPLSYTVSDAGRVTLVDLAAPSAQLPVFWLYDTNKGVGTELENSTGPIGNLLLEGQAPGTYNANSILGLYASGVTPETVPIGFASGTIDATAAGNTAILTQDVTSNGNITTGNVTTLTKAVEGGTGRFTLTGTNIFYNGYVLSPTTLVYFNALSGFTRPVIRIAEK